MELFTFLFAACLISYSHADMDCPTEFRNCTCQSNSVTCSLKRYFTLPEGVTFDLGKTFFYFNGNNLAEIKSTHFKDFVSMSYLSLRDNEISTIDEESFHNNLRLTHIDFSNNLLSFLPVKLFQRLTSLQYIYLGKNKLTRIETDHFIHLSTLQVVRINDNKLGHIGKDALINSQGLRELYLENNQLEIPEKNWLTSFNTTADKYYVYLDGNPWSCDCRMKEFYIWASTHPWFTQHDKDGISVPRCHSPEDLVGISLVRIPGVKDLKCSGVNITSQIRDVKTVEGENIEIPCLATGYPYPDVTISKSGGKEMKSSRNKALLTFPKVKRSDSGIYICNASGYNQNIVSSFETISIRLTVYRTPGNVVTIVIVSLFLIAAGLGVLVWGYKKKYGAKASYGRLSNNNAYYDSSSVAASAVYNAESIHVPPGGPPAPTSVENRYSHREDTAESDEGEDVVAEYAKDTEFLV